MALWTATEGRRSPLVKNTTLTSEKISAALKYFGWILRDVLQPDSIWPEDAVWINQHKEKAFFTESAHWEAPTSLGCLQKHTWRNKQKEKAVSSASFYLAWHTHAHTHTHTHTRTHTHTHTEPPGAKIATLKFLEENHLLVQLQGWTEEDVGWWDLRWKDGGSSPSPRRYGEPSAAPQTTGPVAHAVRVKYNLDQECTAAALCFRSRIIGG